MLKIHINCVELRRSAPKIGVLVLVGALAAGCRAADDGAAAVAVAESLAAPECVADGGLEAELYGAIEGMLDWGPASLECSGMPRPEGRGIRLRFAAAGNNDSTLAFIVAIPDFEQDASVDEFSSNVTVIDQGAARFFSTPDLNNCLAEIADVTAIDDSGDRYAITGAVYCVAPLPEVNGESSVSIQELRFTGLLDWTAS